MTFAGADPLAHLRITAPGLDAAAIEHLGAPRLLIRLGIVDEVPCDDHRIEFIGMRVDRLHQGGEDLDGEDLLGSIGADLAEAQAVDRVGIRKAVEIFQSGRGLRVAHVRVRHVHDAGQDLARDCLGNGLSGDGQLGPAPLVGGCEADAGLRIDCHAQPSMRTISSTSSRRRTRTRSPVAAPPNSEVSRSAMSVLPP